MTRVPRVRAGVALLAAGMLASAPVHGSEAIEELIARRAAMRRAQAESDAAPRRRRR